MTAIDRTTEIPQASLRVDARGAADLLIVADTVAIVCHVYPDADTVGGAVESGSNTVQNTLTPLQKAQNYCSANFPNLSGCVDAYLSGGSGAVSSLQKSLTDTAGKVTGGGGLLN